MGDAIEPDSLSSQLRHRITEAIRANGGWLPFDRYMALALYEPGLGYYANAGRKFGLMPQSGSDFVTAPQMSPMFGRALAVQVAQALQATGSAEVLEFGAGSGALAEQLLDALGPAVTRYTIVDVSGVLRQRQQQRLARHAPRVRWVDAWPESIDGVVLGNEVLDAMPVQLLAWDGTQWLERGVCETDTGWCWGDRPTELRPPNEGPFVPGTVTELHTHAQAYIASLAARLHHAAAFFIDYGFPQDEYYHPQRLGGTLMCHRAHRADPDPLADVGLKDITAHVDFTAIALAAQNAGLQVLGYTSQARFLVNCGIGAMMEQAALPERAMALKLIADHEMGELFKVIGLARGVQFDAIGFAQGDRTHRL